MRHFSLIGLVGLLVSATPSLHAQDLLGSANTATYSYNYVEIQYLPEFEADLPMSVLASIDVTENISLTAQYTQLNDDNIAVGAGRFADFETTAISGGVVFHKPLSFLANSDWIAGLSLGQASSEGRVQESTFGVRTTLAYQDIYLGVRRTFLPKLEGEFGVDILHMDGDTELSGQVKLVYRVISAIDVAVSLSDIGESEYFGFGLRYTWN